MKKSAVSRLAIAALGLGMLVPGLAQAQPVNGENPSMMAMTADLVIARPIGLVATAAGAAVFLVSLPFTAASGSVGQAGEVLVEGPARTTFQRCLGCTRPSRPVNK